MADDKKVQALEGELKLLKGEMKQSLGDVRDYLLSLKLPRSPVEDILGGSDENRLGIDGGLSLGRGKAAAPARPDKPEKVEKASLVKEKEREAPPEKPGKEQHFSRESAPELFQVEAEDELPEEPEEETVPEDTPEAVPETCQEDNLMNASAAPLTPQVNMLANLIRWVAVARSKLGAEQLPTFLEVYGICGNLSLELKDVIMHLSEVVEQQPADAVVADVWSQLLLELHGILSGGGSPLQPLSSFWNGDGKDAQLEAEMEAEIEPEQVKPEEKPLKLKLVLPTDDGEEKEITFSLSPEGNGKASRK